MKPLPPLPLRDLEHVLQHTEELWIQVRGTRIFLSGATGFFGVWLLESLEFCNRRLQLDISATVLCRDPNRIRERLPHIAQSTLFQFIPGDIRSFEWPENDYEFVLHAAAPTTSVASSDPTDLLSILIDGTKNILRFAKARKARSFLFVSSGAVYGPQPESVTHIPEDYRGSVDWMAPSAAYAEGKRVAEQLCNIAASQSGIHTAIARCFAFVGPHLPLDQHFAIGNFIGDALAGHGIAVRGDGTPKRSYLYAADLAIWLWTLLLSEPRAAVNPAVVNVGSDEAISIRELAHKVAAELKPKLRVDVAKAAVPGAQALQYVPNVERARHWYGLKPIISLGDAIQRTANWHRAQD